jgi:outer membrane protein assembly factor BamB
MSASNSFLGDGRPIRLPISLWVTIGFFALVPVARWFHYETDHQMANIVGTGVGLLGCLSAYVGVWIHFGNSPLRRCLIVCVPAALCLAGFALFEFVGFTGEIIPVFRPRVWTAKPKPQVASKAPAITSGVLFLPDPSLSEFESTQFLGSDRNGIVTNQEFSVEWGKQLPTLLWKIPIGAGWSSFAVSNGLAITLEQIEDQESITALELTSGKTVWRLTTPGRHFHVMGGLGPRSTPTIYKDKVIAQSAMGIVSCVQLQSGQLMWQQDLLKLAGIDKETSEKAISWGRSGSPLVFDNQVVVPFGGRSGDSSLRSLVAFDLDSGRELWTGGDQQIAYSSPVLLSLCGVRQIVNINEGTASGYCADNGHVLWTTPWPSNTNGDACSSQAVALDERRILLGKGYALGSKMVEMNYFGTAKENESDGAFWKAETIWANAKILKTKFTSAIAFNGLLYGLSDGVLECVDPTDGSRVWRGKRYGQGQAIIVNGHILIATEDGRVVLVPANAESQGAAIAELPVLEGITWNVPAVAGPYLLVRNAEFAACLISKKDSGQDARTVSQ